MYADFCSVVTQPYRVTCMSVHPFSSILISRYVYIRIIGKIWNNFWRFLVQLGITLFVIWVRYLLDNYQEEKRHWTVNYTSTQNVINIFFIWCLKTFGYFYYILIISWLIPRLIPAMSKLKYLFVAYPLRLWSLVILQYIFMHVKLSFFLSFLIY